jgi:nucleotide-binding universal stress UspA family protein
MYQCIVAGTDLSDTARRATDRASLLAQRLGAEFVLVHAGTRAEERLDALAQEYGGRAEVVAGPPADGLLGAAEKFGADLLVVGSVGMSGARRFMLGNVPNKVSHHAVCDLLIVKTDADPRFSGLYSSVLVGVDGSPTSMSALDAVCELSKALELRPLAICAYEPVHEAELSALRAGEGDAIAQWKVSRTITDTPAEFRWRIAGAATAEDVLDRARDHASNRGVEIEARAIEGQAAESLLAIAEDEGVDLIAVGSVGMSGSKRFSLGNVPNRISHHAPTDVLILKTS